MLLKLHSFRSSAIWLQRRLLTCIVTGSNSGIGKATATELARRGASVILACRNVESGNQAVDEITQKLGNKNVPERLECRSLDLTSLESVKKFADGIKAADIQIDVLINNAGILPPAKAITTEDGYELTFQSNYLGHFLLTNLLLENLRKSPRGGRVINTVADPRMWFLCWPPYGFQFYDPKQPYNQLQAYIRSKLAIQLANTRALHLKNLGISSFSVDPGVMDPSKGRNTSPTFKALLSVMPRFLFKSFEQGAETAVYCATQEGMEKFSGSFFQNCKKINPGSRASDDAMAQRLWDLSEDLVRKYLPANRKSN